MSNNRPLALVTGASSGIGETFARQLAAGGYDLALVARRLERLDALASELRARHGIAVETIAADLTRDEDVARVAARLETTDLELLVNNAGFGTKGYFWVADATRQDAMHRLHIICTERLIRAALPGMVARRRGGIINVSSVAGFIQGPKNISYCASKAWINVFTEGLWMELRQAGSPVKVQALCPGYTLSEFHDVMQANRNEIGKNWWMRADYVVAESLRGLQEGKLFVIPGARYKALVRVLGVTPRRLLRWAASKVKRPGR